MVCSHVVWGPCLAFPQVPSTYNLAGTGATNSLVLALVPELGLNSETSATWYSKFMATIDVPNISL